MRFSQGGNELYRLFIMKIRGVKKKSGFTLIEILVVIGLIAVLAAVVLIAINPGRQFAQARNSQRESNVETILNAIGQQMADNKGVFAAAGCPALTAGTTYDIASGGAAGTIDLSCLTPTYIPGGLPVDPGALNALWTSATSYDTKYSVAVDSSGRYTVSAPNAELGETISVTR